ncbi:hypothetical protein M1L60_07015 [Actinoplanes sp. TRM 88003]|uniref:Uncharacterized protein n=1 Tax=Paractinoplanes aksuensis TaxID=2939490 RepID=A0ABT1DHQ5_9ACTN|nr:hypothetical protein [Actinoplanes aksuensis]MCO8270345.1 hypothetical protein [Actinoplanes aksuensis]
MKTVSRRLALWRADLEAGICAAPEESAQGERDHVVVVMDNRQTFECELRQDVEWQLTGLTWPDDFPPGVLVTVTWHPHRDDFVIRTDPLDDPLRVDGVDYFYAYDPKVVTRDYAPDKSNRAQVLHTVRKLGRVFDDGSAVLSEELLTKRSGLGRGAKGAFLLRNAVDQLIREGFLTRVTGSVDSTGHPSYPAVEGQTETEMVFYAPMVEPIPADSHRGDHWVTGFIRKLPRGAQPSAKRQEAARKAGIGPLAPGYTFVKKHHRNG